MYYTFAAEGGEKNLRGYCKFYFFLNLKNKVYFHQFLKTLSKATFLMCTQAWKSRPPIVVRIKLLKIIFTPQIWAQNIGLSNKYTVMQIPYGSGTKLLKIIFMPKNENKNQNFQTFMPTTMGGGGFSWLCASFFLLYF